MYTPAYHRHVNTLTDCKSPHDVNLPSVLTLSCPQFLTHQTLLWAWIIVPFLISLWIVWGMAPVLPLMILKACCFISCDCQIFPIYISRLRQAREWLLIFFFLVRKMNRSGRRAVGQKKWWGWQELQRNEGQSENVMVYGVKLCVKSQTTTVGRNEGTRTWRVFTATYTQGL